jgi:hypothetical protein
MKTQILIVFLVIALAGCAGAQPNTANVQNTAVAIVGTYVSLTQTALPTATFPPPTFTPTAAIVYPTPSPLPALPPPPIFTPDAIQVERWQEYQTALADFVLLHDGGYEPGVLCEWDILGRSDQKVYVWADCAGSSGQGGGARFAVIYLASDGSVQKMGDQSGSEFPKDVRAKFDLYSDAAFSGRGRVLLDHILYRGTHPEEPPLVILSATAIPTP